MFTMLQTNGEILLTEKYASSSREILYVKPPSQQNVVVLDLGKFKNAMKWLANLFLPQGYPESVSKDYIQYQIWDTAQAFCSTITGTLATQEVLRGVGVGDTTATPLAATVTWVIKDGCGHVGRILFAFSHGSYLDAFSKKWRLYADVLNDAAMCMEIALPLFGKNYVTFVLCITTVMKSIVGVAGGATRAALTQHHALRGNLADVSAKDSAQETAVNLVASFTALLIINIFGNSMFLFTMLILLHIICNYMAVRAVCLRTLNGPRFLQTIDWYLRKEEISSPCTINRIEPIVFYQIGSNILDLKLCGFQIKIGSSIKRFMREKPSSLFLKKMNDIYRLQKYILLPNIDRRLMYIMIKESANTEDILMSYFHAVLLSIIICAINNDNMAVYSNRDDPRPFARVCHTLQEVNWSRELRRNAEFRFGFKFKPSIQLYSYVQKIAQEEWVRVRHGLDVTGWDMTKHLLVVDEWRIVNNEMSPTVIEQDPEESAGPAFVKTFDEVNTPSLTLSRDSLTIEPDDDYSFQKIDDSDLMMSKEKDD